MSMWCTFEEIVMDKTGRAHGRSEPFSRSLMQKLQIEK